MLRYHLTRDHADVQTSWRVENGLPQYTFHLPEPVPAEDSESEEEEEDLVEEPSAVPESSDGELEYLDPPPEPPSPSHSPPDSPVISRSRTPAAVEAAQKQRHPSPMQVDESDTGVDTTSPFSRAHTTTSTSATTLAAAPSQTLSVIPKHEYEEAVLPREATPRKSPPRTPRTGLSAAGELVPPPVLNPLGPAAEPPLESCRPGGPKIYDLLNELPLEPYGVLEWTIVDREEEIFEFADVLDEDKVMMALWNRWIFFNRVSFVFNREDGTCRAGVQRFIDANYAMIHRAAGWAALRAFLIILTGNRFINIRDVLKLLDHYDRLVKRKEWYK
ncbi:hypothetical protein PsYK624_025840 [Phanerochaete sordida]|uniref:Uncharacterized protein n=1 Tax=Phanerochaete sordida TaxID=48140 RepID=A0A9P3G260_9APHY|nr:hypothetical protein PsYK624_025840 [Phanerochaete sordida]